MLLAVEPSPPEQICTVVSQLGPSSQLGQQKMEPLTSRCCSLAVRFLPWVACRCAAIFALIPWSSPACWLEGMWSLHTPGPPRSVDERHLVGMWTLAVNNCPCWSGLTCWHAVFWPLIATAGWNVSQGHLSQPSLPAAVRPQGLKSFACQGLKWGGRFLFNVS